MPTPYIEDLADEFDLFDDWVEEIGDNNPGSIQMSNDAQGATVVGFVPANKVRACVRWFLGYSYADTAAPWKLRRENPEFHPEWSQLRAYDIDIRKFIPEANTDNPNNSPYLPSPFTDYSFYAKYKWMRVTVRYRNFLYRFRTDDEIAVSEQEWRRNTQVFTEPSVEALTVTGGMSQLKFAETGPTGPTAGTTPFGAPMAMLLAKKMITVKWFAVPWEYLSEDDFVFTPTKLDAVVGKVNSDTFMDRYPPGTLLGMPYSAEPATWAVAPEYQGDPLRLMNVTLRFSFFDPPRGAAAPLARGHNLMPWGGTGTDATKGGDGKFYYATRDGTPTGAPLIPTAAFEPVYTHVQS